MLDKTKLKMLDRNVYFRERMEGVYSKKHPEMRVRQATKDFLTKKQALSETQQGEEGELLNSLMDNIRAILANENIDAVKVRRRAKK